MRRIFLSLSLAFAAALLATASTPAAARAQCHWGCHCEGTACGCNSLGSGSSCDTGGTGCVVYKCAPQMLLRFAPDGSAVRLASRSGARRGAAARAGSPRYRWEYVALGRSAARDCKGLVVARYFDRATAAATRQRQRTLMI